MDQKNDPAVGAKNLPRLPHGGGWPRDWKVQIADDGPADKSVAQMLEQVPFGKKKEVSRRSSTAQILRALSLPSTPAILRPG